MAAADDEAHRFFVARLLASYAAARMDRASAVHALHATLGALGAAGGFDNGAALDDFIDRLVLSHRLPAFTPALTADDLLPYIPAAAPPPPLGDEEVQERPPPPPKKQRKATKSRKAAAKEQQSAAKEQPEAERHWAEEPYEQLAAQASENAAAADNDWQKQPSDLDWPRVVAFCALPAPPPAPPLAVIPAPSALAQPDAASFSVIPIPDAPIAASSSSSSSSAASSPNDGGGAAVVVVVVLRGEALALGCAELAQLLDEALRTDRLAADLIYALTRPAAAATVVRFPDPVRGATSVVQLIRGWLAADANRQTVRWPLRIRSSVGCAVCAVMAGPEEPGLRRRIMTALNNEDGGAAAVVTDNFLQMHLTMGRVFLASPALVDVMTRSDLIAPPPYSRARALLRVRRFAGVRAFLEAYWSALAARLGVPPPRTQPDSFTAIQLWNSGGGGGGGGSAAAV